MRALLSVLLMMAAVSCQTITEPDIAQQEPPAPEAPMRVAGYHAWWSGTAWRTYDFQALDQLYFFSLEVGPDGNLTERRGWPESWQGLISTARATGTSIIPTVTILDSETYRSVFGDTTAVANLLQQLVALATDVSADGIHLDFEMFETIPWQSRQATTDLVIDLRERLGEVRPEASISMFMLGEDPADVLDEAAIIPHLDYAVVQAYDMHWQTGDRAGPVAPVDGWSGRNWRTLLARFEAMGVPTGKMLFTVPYFGYEWPTESYLPGAATTGPATILAYGTAAEGLPSARARAEQYGKLRDTVSGSPYYAYRDSIGSWRQGWFEDAQSIALKYEFAVGEGLGGVAIFPLAYGDGDLHATLTAARYGQDKVSP